MFLWTFFYFDSSPSGTCFFDIAPQIPEAFLFFTLFFSFSLCIRMGFFSLFSYLPILFLSSSFCYTFLPMNLKVASIEFFQFENFHLLMLSSISLFLILNFILWIFSFISLNIIIIVALSLSLCDNSNIWVISKLGPLRLGYIFLVLCMLNYFGLYLGHCEYYTVKTLQSVIYSKEYWYLLISICLWRNSPRQGKEPLEKVRGSGAQCPCRP